MTNQFYQQQASNRYDSIALDVDHLYQSWPYDRKDKPMLNRPQWASSVFHSLYRFPLLPLRAREYVWQAARRSRLDQAWFEAFKDYWQAVIEGRPLWGVEDLYFLRGLYRIKFQNNQIPDGADASIHVQAWQRPEVLYQLLHLVYKESFINELTIVRLLQRFSARRPRRLLEFGAATAPITTSLFEFLVDAPNIHFTIADIKTLAFHYGAYKFRACANVVPVLLEADTDFSLPASEKFDAIFSITVFEHLPHPLETMQRLHELLEPGGLLIFDYIKSDGGGLDTMQSMRDRAQVLQFVSQHFSILHGRIDAADSVPLTVACKK